MALKALLAVFWLFALPLILGESLALGYVILLCFMEVLAVPCIFAGIPLRILSLVYGACLIIYTLYTLWRHGKEILERFKEKLSFLKKGGPWLYLALLFILFQCGAVAVLTHFDADDAFYVATAVTDVAEDTIYGVNPYTGFAYEELPKRYTLSPFPVFLSVMSRLCGGLHPAVLAHVFFPAFFLLAVYSALAMVGKHFFPKDPPGQGLFLFFASVAMAFSCWTIYNAGNFAMIRIWQGKAFLAGAFLPLLWLMATRYLMEDTQQSPVPLFMTVLSCCHLSSMGIALSPVVLFCCLISALLRRRPIKRILTGALCMAPALGLGLFYVLYW